MLLFQASYKREVGQYLVGKEHVSDGIGVEQFLDYILIFSAVLFMTSILMSTFMLIRRYWMNKKKTVDQGLIEKYQNFLSAFLVLPVDDAFLGIQKSDKIEYRLDSKDISNPHRRMLLSKEIYALKKNLCGQQESQLTNYFYGLGLQTDVARMLKSNNWAAKVNAMQMIHAFNIVEYIPLVRSYINSENRELAIHAICAIINIEKSVDVLFDVNQKLNKWECHKVVDVIKKLKLSAAKIEPLLNQIKHEESHLHFLTIGLLETKSSDLSTTLI